MSLIPVPDFGPSNEADFTISIETWQFTNIEEESERCTICQKTFTTAHSLKVHYRTHTGLKPFVCEMCNKAFSTKHYLFIHYRIHTGEKPHVCEVCQEAFQTKFSFKVHKQYCGKKQFVPDNNKETTVLSTGLKQDQKGKYYKRCKHTCELCHRTFRSRTAFTSHIVTHTNKNSQSQQIAK